MLPLLKGGDGKPAFHLVAPSLPNYGFSAPCREQGFNIGRYAESCHKVMLALGYDQYVTQGASDLLYPASGSGVLTFSLLRAIGATSSPGPSRTSTPNTSKRIT
jgi:hypothetical protein